MKIARNNAENHGLWIPIYQTKFPQPWLLAWARSLLILALFGIFGPMSQESGKSIT
jgi:hypothetical protein